MAELLRDVLRHTAAGVDRVAAREPGISVLIYHRVGGGSTSQVDLDPGLFADQMAAIAHRVVTLDDALELLVGPPPAAMGGSPDEDPVVVTFDDGTPDVVETALPILVDHGVPALLYLATDFVESQRPFWQPDDPTLSWAALADAVDTGVLSVGSHTHTHALLDRLAPDAIADELDRSVDLIGERLGVVAQHFAYPKALPPSPAAAAAVQERFASAALAGTRANPYGRTDPHRLWRSPVQQRDGLQWFAHKADGGLGLEDRIRDLVNRRRYAGATT